MNVTNGGVMGLDGNVAVVTGAGSGLGAGLAARLAARGVRVVVADLDAPAVNDVADRLRANGAEVAAVVVDVTDEVAVRSMFTDAIDRYGTVDLAFLNAGVQLRGNVWDLSESDWRWVFDVNVFGVINGIRAIVPFMMERNSGHVVLTASNSSVAAAAGIGAYIASKHALLSVGETLHHDLQAAHSEVAVSVVMPSAIRSRMFDSYKHRQPRYGAAEVNESTVAAARAFIEQYGTDPEKMADIILERALGAKLLYVFTDEQDLAMLDARVEGIRSGRGSAPSRPGVSATGVPSTA